MSTDEKQIYYSATGFLGRSIVFGVLVGFFTGWNVSDASLVKIIVVVLFAGGWTLGLSILQVTNIEYGVIFVLGVLISVALYKYGHPEFLRPYLIAAFIGSVNGILGRSTRRKWEINQLYGKEAQESSGEEKQDKPRLPG